MNDIGYCENWFILRDLKELVSFVWFDRFS